MTSSSGSLWGSKCHELSEWINRARISGSMSTDDGLFRAVRRGRGERKRWAKDVHMVPLLADDGLCMMTDVYENLRISGGRTVCWRGTSGVRTCHGPGFTAVCFLPASPAMTAPLISERERETADVDATAPAHIV